jgi:hypothetical protein
VTATGADPPARVLFVVLDGVSPRHVDETVMPGLAELAGAGAWSRPGGIGVLPSSTYPNHATFVTGRSPAEHGIVANELPTDEGPVPSWERGPSVPTLFDSMRSAGRTSAAVFGDLHLLGVTGAGSASFHWPEGDFADDVSLDILGYAKDVETVARIRRAVDMGAELIVAQLNEPDTVAHIFGPDSPEALQRYGRADAHLAGLVESLRDQWAAWAVVVVSDHGQEEVTEPDPVDLRAEAARRGLGGLVIDDGAVAVMAGEMARDVAWTDSVAGVEGVRRLDSDSVLVWSTAGRWFSSVPLPVHGVHGSPRTLGQIAVVTGGHPGVRALGAGLAGARPSSTRWAPAVAGLLGVTPPGDLHRPRAAGGVPGR